MTTSRREGKNRTSERDNNSVPSTSSNLSKAKEFSCARSFVAYIGCVFCVHSGFFDTFLQSHLWVLFGLQSLISCTVCVVFWLMISHQFYYSPLHFFVVHFARFPVVLHSHSISLTLSIIFVHSMVVAFFFLFCTYTKCAININISLRFFSFSFGFSLLLCRCQCISLVIQCERAQAHIKLDTRKIHFVLKIIIYLILLIFPIFAVYLRVSCCNFFVIPLQASLFHCRVDRIFFSLVIVVVVVIIVAVSFLVPFFVFRIVHLFWRAPNKR